MQMCSPEVCFFAGWVPMPAMHQIQLQRAGLWTRHHHHPGTALHGLPGRLQDLRHRDKDAQRGLHLRQPRGVCGDHHPSPSLGLRRVKSERSSCDVTVLPWCQHCSIHIPPPRIATPCLSLHIGLGLSVGQFYDHFPSVLLHSFMAFPPFLQTSLCTVFCLNHCLFYNPW